MPAAAVVGNEEMSALSGSAPEWILNVSGIKSAASQLRIKVLRISRQQPLKTAWTVAASKRRRSA